MVLLVMYDIHNPGRDYDDVIKVIKSAGAWLHIQESVWAIDTQIPITDWIKRLRTAGDANDEYFINRIPGTHAWDCWMSRDKIDWLKSPYRTY